MNQVMLHLIMRTRSANRALRRGLPAWRSRARARRDASLRLCRNLVRVCMSTEVRRPVQLAVRAALRQATFRRGLAPRRRAQVAQSIPPLRAPDLIGQERASKPGYAPGEKGTLELGSWIVLGTLSLGLQLGRWPAWTALAAAGGYLAWIVSYSEATVQARRRRLTAGRPAFPAALHPPSAPPEE